MAAIRHLLAARANVLHEGKRTTIDGTQLVLDDIVLLEAGDKFPADLRLVTAHGLSVQEGILTGESVPVEKQTQTVPENAALGDRSCMVYSGTLVSAGQGKDLSVAAIPEGLPAVLTITLAIGVQAMARRNAIVRRLPARETLGAVSVICTDKKGTLTRNEMMVASVLTLRHLLTVEGSGYKPKGALKLEETQIEPYSLLSFGPMIFGQIRRYRSRQSCTLWVGLAIAGER